MMQVLDLEELPPDPLAPHLRSFLLGVDAVDPEKLDDLLTHPRIPRLGSLFPGRRMQCIEVSLTAQHSERVVIVSARYVPLDSRPISEN